MRIGLPKNIESDLISKTELAAQIQSRSNTMSPCRTQLHLLAQDMTLGVIGQARMVQAHNIILTQ